MTIYAQTWEHTLLAWAVEPLLEKVVQHHILPTSNPLLDAAYEHCKQITRHYSRTFYMASSLLPYEKRRAVHALYAMCRITDDIVDHAEADTNPLATLEDWYQRLSHQKATIHHPVILAWADAKARFAIPQSYLRQLVDGVAMDMQQTTYQCFDDLAKYSYGVASTVGLMAMHITGYTSKEAIPYAVKLGVALQMTNILRDIGEDWRNGRLYLPQDELHAYGLNEDSIRAGKVTNKWRDFMRFQIDRNRELYAESLPGISYLNSDGRFAIAAAAELYQAILTDIEAHDYDVFTRRARVSTAAKLAQLPAIWWRSYRGTYSRK